MSPEPEDAKEPPPGAGPGGVTWLREELLSEPLEGIEYDDPSAPRPPDRTVWQAVSLEPGTYLLSWWDQARADDCAISLAGPYTSQLIAGVYDESWMPITVDMVVAHAWDSSGSSGAKLWSARRTLEFTIPKLGVYHVGFGVSLMNELPGSVAIANVQLERVSAAGSTPTAYIQTGLTRQYVTSDCENLSAEDFRAAFRYQCQSDGACYYELDKPIIVDKRDLGKPTSRFNGKIASGSFNLRHMTMAVNLVGTGIRDCEEGGSMGCYGSGFTEYTVNHDAFLTRIVGYKNTAQSFNFGSAAINHGKALTTERYITMPIGNADNSTLAQPGIEKSEFRGRPLDGSYRLRIWDNGQMRWDRLEDVQLVLKYRYWSAIDRQPSGM